MAHATIGRLAVSAAAAALLLAMQAPAQPGAAAATAAVPPPAASPFAHFYSPDPAVAPAPSPGVPPLPKWSLIPRTETSIPLTTDILPSGAPSDLMAMPLARYGYVEDEYLISGTANIYSGDYNDYKPDSVNGVAKSNVPYVTRMIIRRPADVSKFSGTIVMEPMRDMTAFDTVWLEAAPYMLQHGDVFVTFTMATDNVPMLINHYDSKRYGAINISDDGLRWDIMAQVAGLARSEAGPLAQQGYLARARQVKGGLRLYSTGASLTGRMQLYFIDKGHHARARRADGGPIIDGYLPVIAGLPLDPPSDAPVIRVISESEYLVPNPPTQPGTWRARLPDSDGPGSRVREYDVAGSSHMGKILQTQYMVPMYQMGALTATSCQHEIPELPSHAHVVAAALANLDAWVREGVLPPPSQLFELNPDHSLKRDQYGNVMGGVRNFWVQAPLGSFHSDNTAQAGLGPDVHTACPMLGYELPLSPEVVHGLYKSKADYIGQTNRAIDALAKARLILPEDAENEKALAERMALP